MLTAYSTLLSCDTELRRQRRLPSRSGVAATEAMSRFRRPHGGENGIDRDIILPGQEGDDLFPVAQGPFDML